MFFSCKITHSALNYLEKEGRDLDSLFEDLDAPREFLKDTSYWLEASKMETFLERVESQFSENGESVIEKIGHACPKLRSWGVLDSVLRMMKQPEDMYSQPQRFLSYFISPEPPIGNVARKGNSISFSIPLAIEEHPHFAAFLCAALESLPCYVEASPSKVTWQGSQINIIWSKDQESFFKDEDDGRQISPDFMHSIEVSLEKSQKDLEKKNEELLRKSNEIKALKARLQQYEDGKINTKISEPAKTPRQEASELMPYLVRARGQVMRLADYVARAQQLVTILVGQNRMDRQVQEAMRRLDWELLSREYPQVAQEASNELSHIREAIKGSVGLNLSKPTLLAEKKSRQVDLPF